MAASSAVKGALQVGAIRQLGRTGKGGFGDNTTLALLGLFGGALLIYAGWKRKPVLSVLAGIAVPTRPSAFTNLQSGAAASGLGVPGGGTVNAALNTMGAAIGGVISKAHLGRTDEGVDFTGAGPVPAVGAGTITHVTTSSGWPGGTFITERLDTPAAGHQYVYYAENIAPSVQQGQRVAAGTSVGQARGSYPYIEVGWANDATSNLAAAHGHYTEGQVTAEGQSFKQFLGL